MDQSISMDLVETISEIGFSERSLMELKRLFLQEQPIEKATLFDVGKFYTYRLSRSLYNLVHIINVCLFHHFLLQ